MNKAKLLMLILVGFLVFSVVAAPLAHAAGIFNVDDDGDGYTNKDEELTRHDKDNANDFPTDAEVTAARASQGQDDPWIAAAKVMVKMGGDEIPWEQWYVIPITITIVTLLVITGLKSTIFKEQSGFGGIGGNWQDAVAIIIGVCFGFIAVALGPVEAWFASVGVWLLLVALGGLAFYLIILLVSKGISGSYTAIAGAHKEGMAERKAWITERKAFGAELKTFKQEKQLARNEAKAVKEIENVTIAAERANRSAEEEISEIRNAAGELLTAVSQNAPNSPISPLLARALQPKILALRSMITNYERLDEQGVADMQEASRLLGELGHLCAVSLQDLRNLGRDDAQINQINSNIGPLGTNQRNQLKHELGVIEGQAERIISRINTAEVTRSRAAQNYERLDASLSNIQRSLSEGAAQLKSRLGRVYQLISAQSSTVGQLISELDAFLHETQNIRNLWAEEDKIYQQVNTDCAEMLDSSKIHLQLIQDLQLLQQRAVQVAEEEGQRDAQGRVIE